MAETSRSFFKTVLIAGAIFLAGYWAGSPKKVHKVYHNFDIHADAIVEPHVDICQWDSTGTLEGGFKRLGIERIYMGSWNSFQRLEDTTMSPDDKQKIRDNVRKYLDRK